MPHELLAPIYAGARFEMVEGKPARFVKDILAIGHSYRGEGPMGPWETDVTRQLAEKIVATFYELREAGHRIPAPEDHYGQNHGFWEEMWLGRNEGTLDEPKWVTDPKNGTHLVGELEVTLPNSGVGTTLKEASIGLAPKYIDGEDRKFEQAPVHIAPCIEPVVPGQANFVKIAASASGAERIIVWLSEKQESPMDPKKLRELFGIGDDVPDDRLLDAIVAKKAEVEAEHTKLGEAVAELKAELEAAKKAADEGEGEGEGEGGGNTNGEAAEQAKVVASLTASNARLYRENVRRRANDLIRMGQITPAMAKTVELDKCEIAMSEHGVDDALELQLKTWANIPAGTFPTDKTITMSQHDGKPGDEEPSQEELGEKQGELVKQYSPAAG